MLTVQRMMGRLGQIVHDEFAGYHRGLLQHDLLAGITVGAVALPLALAFGVASGADPAAGLITAILAGIIIAGLGGSAFQISGPTGAMSAVLIVLAQRYGLGGVWVASVLAGIAMVLLGLFRLGRYISFIPSPVITGFTSGIALIIAIGQIDNVLGTKTPAAENALAKLFQYVRDPPIPDMRAIILAGVVIATMLLLPRLTRTLPGSLVGLVIATILTTLLGWQVPVIGSIPQTIFLEQRLTFSAIPWNQLGELVTPAISIAALGAIESLLCGAVGATMTGKPFNSNQELIGQGIGNIIIPFFGGVPATAAIARTSVAIKSGGVTRLTSIIHAGVLLLSVFVLAPLISRVPLAALGGVLMVTAWRMNEWEALHFFAQSRLKHALIGVLVTTLATVALDLTQAILIGIAISALVYLRQSAASLGVESRPVDLGRMQSQGHTTLDELPDTHVVYLTGPLFFGSVHAVLEAFRRADTSRNVVISMRGVPLIDVMGVQALEQVLDTHRARGGTVVLSGVQPAVREMLDRTDLTERIGEDHFFWSADQAILWLSRQKSISG